ncbi:PUA-like domain-containing protein [Lenzites betulinus]|nr:PUA-like domain-containing protein [Lenzites betulinus]
MRILCTHDRLFLHHSSVHSGILAGIAGSKDEGCYSVVLSGGYEDDRDEGYKFTYTGCGGRDRKDGEKVEGPQTCDQSWQNSRNQSLRVSSYTKKPVRVVRGYKSRSDFAPAEGYRYDGLYVVERAWMDVGKSGFQICKYSLSVRSITRHFKLLESHTGHLSAPSGPTAYPSARRHIESGLIPMGETEAFRKR